MERMRPDAGRSAGAIVLIGIGVLFLLAQVFNLDFFGALWPLLIILPGLAFLAVAITGGTQSAPFIFPGVMVTGTGAILFAQNVTGHWESWAYVWTLYPSFVGLALMFIGQRTGNVHQINVGRGMFTWGLIAFVGFFLFFEGLIFGSFGGARFLLPLLLIAGGVALLFRRSIPAITTEKRKFGDDL